MQAVDTNVVIAGFATWHDGHDAALAQGEDLPLAAGPTGRDAESGK